MFDPRPQISSTCLVLERADVPKVGRGAGIRTPDPLLPKQGLYQAELRPDGVRRAGNEQALRGDASRAEGQEAEAAQDGIF